MCSRRKISLENNLGGVDTLIVCISMRHKTDFAVRLLLNMLACSVGSEDLFNVKCVTLYCVML